MKTTLCFAALLTGLLLSGANLLLNPASGKLRADKLSPGISAQVHDGVVDLTIEGANRQQNFDLPIAPDTRFLRIRTRMRTSGVVPGKANWQNARLAMRFHGKDWKPVGEWPEVFNGKGDSDWIVCDRLYPVPAGAARLLLGPANFGSAGKVEFFDLSVEPLSPPEKSSNLVASPAFAMLKSGKMPAGMSLAVDGDQVDLTIEGANRQWNISLPVEPGVKFIRLTTRMRATDLEVGAEGWQDGRLALRFRNKNHKEVGEWPSVFCARGTTGWLECDRLYPVPEGATEFTLGPANFGKSGKIEFFGLRVQGISSIDNLDLDVPPPDGSKPETLGSLEGAWRESTPTRERVSLNGLWEFRPLFPGEQPGAIPPKGSGWGYFKVPGAWPTQGNGMRFYVSPLVLPKLTHQDLNSAWYRRTFRVPSSWQGKKIVLSADLIQSCAKVFVDGKDAGEFYYPGGDVDLTGKLIPGREQTLAILVSAKPEESSNFMAPGRLIALKSALANRGITSDLYLEARPETHAVSDVHVITSVKDKKISFDTGFSALPAGEYQLQADVLDAGKIVKQFVSKPFRSEGKIGLRHTFSGSWSDPKLWDTDTPHNLYVANVKLLSGDGKKILDQFLPQEFGFREFLINGRDFYLNGKKLYLRMLVTKTPQESDFGSDFWIEHLVNSARGFGANFLIGWNYSFAPGIFSYPDGFHKGTSKRGMLTSLTLPHVKDFKPNLDDPVQAEAYRRQAEHLIRRYQNVPGVVMLVMNHNAMGYMGDQNPLRIGTSYRPEDAQQPGAMPNRIQARKAEAIAKSLDNTRPVYHHESGNLGDVYTLNCYLNWSPRQERSDWLENWEKNGTMPLMFVEWGLPHVASWSSFRGPSFIWSSTVLQCLWFNEYNAAILGEEAYRAEEAKEKQYTVEEKMIKGNRATSFHRIGGNGSLNRIEDVNKVRAYYAERNFRDLRWRGISGLLPWDQFLCWSWLGGKGATGDNPQRFADLKRPGLVPDRLTGRGEYINNPFAEYRLNTTGKAIAANFGEFLGWLGGASGDITENGHNFRAGETVRKSLALINDSRRDAEVRWSWQVPALKLSKSGAVKLVPGERATVPVEFQIPAGTQGEIVLDASIEFPGSKRFEDRLAFQVIPRSPVKIAAKVGVFDPEGKAKTMLKNIGVNFRTISKDADLDGIELLVVGRGALAENPLQLSKRLENGLKLFVLEQPLTVFDRLGIRGNEQGYREIFSLSPEFSDMRDWRGSATLLPGYFPPPPYEISNPRWRWNGFDHNRVWRAGNRGSITEVVIEKPSIGNWLPLLQAGFDLQYAPLLEFTEGKGRIMFCQAAVSGRSQNEPEAEELFRKALVRLDRARPAVSREVFYAGSKEGADLLASLRIAFKPYEGKLPAQALLVIGPGTSVSNLTDAVKRGCRILALGLSGKELELAMPGAFQFESGDFYSDLVNGLREQPEFAGISNADLHWRGKIKFDAFKDNKFGRNLAIRNDGKGCFVALQLPPWKFDAKEFYYRTTRRRAAFLCSRLLANLGAKADTGLYALFDGIQGNSHFELPNERWIGKADPDKKGRDQKWYAPEFRADSTWRKTRVPGTFESQFKDLIEYDGYFWYRLEFELPSSLVDSKAELFLGSVDDESWVWLNGQFLGEVTKKTHPNDYWQFHRNYSLKPGQLKPGRNVLVVLCNDTFNTGGILSKPGLKFQGKFNFYTDFPQSSDNPYKYYRW